MRHFLTLILILTTYTLTAQNAGTELKSQWNSVDEWIPETKELSTFFHDDNGECVFDQRDLWVWTYDGEGWFWDFYWRRLFNYNDQWQLTSLVTEMPSDEIWFPFGYVAYTYDADGHVVEELHQYAPGEEDDQYKIISVYGVEGFLLEVREEFWLDEMWVPTTRNIYQYNEAGERTHRTHAYYMQATEMWIEDDLEIFYYGSSENSDTLRSYVWFESEQQWASSTRIVTHYNPDGSVQSILRGDDTFLADSSDFIYQDGNLLLNTYFKVYPEGATPFYHIEYSDYCEDFVGIDEADATDLLLFPNPGSIPVLQVPTNWNGATMIEVYDGKGMVVLGKKMSLNGMQKITLNELEKLPPGVYSFRLRQNTKVLNTRWVKM